MISPYRFPALALLLSACASSPYPDIDEPLPPGAQSARDVPAAQVASASVAVSAGGTLQRTDVERVIDAGLGRFLSLVVLEPSLAAGKFTGWSIVRLDPPEFWQGVDLRPGDVVTRINDHSIEREGEAYDAFQRVRQAPTLEVSYVREGQPRSLRYTIVGKPSPAIPAAPASAAAPAAAPAKR